ncbi:MAG TPA: glycosyltransferase family 2 protein [Planctomycetes bacterium]|nr:glycosyltransferase family 2 protein [Planctomycetota bacterium]
MAIELSLVIPAYNEAQRLPPFLDSVRRHLQCHYPGRHQVIVVDDGSRDGLGEVLEDWRRGWDRLTVIRHGANQGKGAAVRTGMLAACGQRMLFADADGATPIEEELKLSAAIRAGADMAVGSRLVTSAEVVRRRKWSRAMAGRLFAAAARGWLGIRVRDTQCGFKMFRHDAGRALFGRSQETGYLFDLEVLALAQRLGYRIVEVPVNWREVPGGHLSLLGQSGRIVAALWRLRKRLEQHSRCMPTRGTHPDR